jgi:hypothetical protein
MAEDYFEARKRAANEAEADMAGADPAQANSDVYSAYFTEGGLLTPGGLSGLGQQMHDTRVAQAQAKMAEDHADEGGGLARKKALQQAQAYNPLSGFTSNLRNIYNWEAGQDVHNWIPKVSREEMLPFQDFVRLADEQGLIEWRDVGGEMLPFQAGSEDNTVADMYRVMYFTHPERSGSFFDKYVNPLGILTGDNVIADKLLWSNPVSEKISDFIGIDSLAPKDVMDKYGRQITLGMLGYMTGGAAAGLFGAAGGAAGAGAGAAAGAGANLLTQPIMQAAVQGAAAGAVNALANGQNILEGALKGAISGGAGGAAVGAAGLDSRYLNAALNGATRAATQAAVNGGDIWTAAAQGALAGLSTSADLGTLKEDIGSALGGQSTPDFAGVTDADLAMDMESPSLYTRPGGYTPISMTSPEQTLFGTGMLSQPVAAPMTAAAADFAPLSPEQMLFGSTLSTALPEAEAESEPEGVQDSDVAMEPPAATEESALDTAGRYASYAAKAYDLYKKLNPEAMKVPEFDVPEQGDMTDDEYRQVLGDAAIEYMGLDADEMRSRGLEPGTQAYLDYILARADMLIEAAFGQNPDALFEGESVEGLQQALRGKTQEEMEALSRALYVRGALGGSTFSKEFTDPFSGEAMDLGTLAGESVEGSRAAAQRGYARFLQDAARLSGPESRAAIRGLLGRDVDLFDLEMKRGKNLQDLLDPLLASAPEDEEEFDQYGRRGKAKGRGKSKGMLPVQDETFWRNVFGRDY